MGSTKASANPASPANPTSMGTANARSAEPGSTWDEAYAGWLASEAEVVKRPLPAPRATPRSARAVTKSDPRLAVVLSEELAAEISRPHEILF